MTLTEVTNQIYDLTIAGYINGEKFTKKEFNHNMHHFFNDCGFTKKKDYMLNQASKPLTEAVFIFFKNKY